MTDRCGETNAGAIVLLAIDFPPVVGGIARYLSDIVRAISSRKVAVICPPAPAGTDFPTAFFQATRFRLPRHWDPYRSHLKYLAPMFYAELQRHDAGMVLCGQAHLSVLVPAWLNWKTRGVRYGVFTYGLDLLQPQRRAYRPVFNALLRGADVVFSDSRAAAAVALRIGVEPTHLTIVYPSVDPARFAGGTTAADVRRKHSIGSRKCVLTVGRLIERKGHDVLLRAMRTVRDAVPDVRLLIVGSGPRRRALEDQVVELGLGGHVSFAGYVPDQEMTGYYAACDVFAMISRELLDSADMEGFGTVFLEAGLFGKPVVGGASGGVSEAIAHQASGLLVDPLNHRDVATALTLLLTDASLASTLGEEGKRRALEQFSPVAAARAVLAAIERRGQQARLHDGANRRPSIADGGASDRGAPG